jgi:hypothetical protein
LQNYCKPVPTKRGNLASRLDPWIKDAMKREANFRRKGMFYLFAFDSI